GDIAGKIGDVLLLQKLEGLNAQRVLLVGCGKASELTGKKYVQVVRHASKALVKHGQLTAAAALLDLPVKDEDARHLAELLTRTVTALQYRYSTTKPKAAKAPEL